MFIETLEARVLAKVASIQLVVQDRGSSGERVNVTCFRWIPLLIHVRPPSVYLTIPGITADLS